MTDWFFYQERGQTMGPVTVGELRTRVGDGRLRAFDLIYKEGEAGWKMAMEHADLRDAFRGAGQNPMKGRPWVCLRRKGEDSFDFVTDGPYSDDEIRTALSSGRLGYADYLWRNEFSEWQRVGSIETFNPRTRAAAPAPREPTADELLGNVVELKRERHVAPVVEIPSEADGEDLIVAKTTGRPAPPSEEETRIIMRRSLPPPEVTDPSARPPPPPPSSLTNKVTAKTATKKSASATKNTTKVRAASAADAAAITVMVKSKRDAATTGAAAKNEDGARIDPPADPPRRTRSGKSRERTASGPAIFTERRKKRRGPSVWSDWGIVIGLVAVLVLGLGYVIGTRVARSRNVAVGSPPLNPLPLPLPTLPAVKAVAPTGKPADSVAAKGATTPAPPPPGPSVSGPSVSDGLVDSGLTTEAVDVAADASGDVGTAGDEPEVEGAKPASKVAPAAPTRPPTELRLNVSATSAGKARIDLRSNGSVDVPIFLQVIGAPGQIADAPAYYRYVKMASTGSLGAPVEPPNLDLPQGRYRLVAESGGLKRETTLNLGVGESKFRQAVGRQRKLGAAALWQERLNLYRVAQAVTLAMQQNGVGRRLAPRSFQTLDGVRKSTGARYLFYDEWTELKAIVESGRVRITAEGVARARRARDRVASSSLWRPSPG